MGMEKSVGLILVVNIPKIGPAAVLQVRGEYNFERWQPESWPGGCHVTVHGKIDLKKDHDVREALTREMEEEIGHAALCYIIMKDRGRSPPEIIYEGDSVTTFFAYEERSDFLKHIRLQPGSGGLRLLTPLKVDDIRDLTKFRKEFAVPNDVTAMFPDEIEAVKKAFEKCS